MNTLNLKSLVVIVLRLYAVYFFATVLFNLIPYISFLFDGIHSEGFIGTIMIGIVGSFFYLILAFLLWHFSIRISDKLIWGLNPDDLKTEINYEYFERIVFAVAGIIIAVRTIPSLVYPIIELFVGTYDQAYAVSGYSTHKYSQVIVNLVLFIFSLLLIFGKENILNFFKKIHKVSKAR